MNIHSFPIITRRKAALAVIGGLLDLSLGSDKAKSMAPRDNSGQPPNLGDERAAWLSLPPTPSLPEAVKMGLFPVDGGSAFYAQFGKGPSITFLHGGLANSNYWGHQISDLSSDFSVTVMDTRGHGRSPLTSSDFSYRAFAKDVSVLLKFLDIRKTAIVGWSDGAVTGLQLALSAPELVTGLFAFGANSDLSGLKTGGSKTPVFSMFVRRAEAEYTALSPDPGRWHSLVAGLIHMWRSQPNFTLKQLNAERPPTTISDGEHDEVIRREHTERLAHAIPGAKLLIQPDVSHFAMLQKPSQFSDSLRQFLSSFH